MNTRRLVALWRVTRQHHADRRAILERQVATQRVMEAELAARVRHLELEELDLRREVDRFTTATERAAADVARLRASAFVPPLVGHHRPHA